MKTISILGNKFTVESWWNWVCVDEDGEVNLFYQEPTFEYWNGYKDGRLWDVHGCSEEWTCLGAIDNPGGGCAYRI